MLNPCPKIDLLNSSSFLSRDTNTISRPFSLPLIASRAPAYMLLSFGVNARHGAHYDADTYTPTTLGPARAVGVSYMSRETSGVSFQTRGGLFRAAPVFVSAVWALPPPFLLFREPELRFLFPELSPSLMPCSRDTCTTIDRTTPYKAVETVTGQRPHNIAGPHWLLGHFLVDSWSIFFRIPQPDNGTRRGWRQGWRCRYAAQSQALLRRLCRVFVEWRDEFEGDALNRSLWSVVCSNMSAPGCRLPFITAVQRRRVPIRALRLDMVSVENGSLVLTSRRVGAPGNASNGWLQARSRRATAGHRRRQYRHVYPRSYPAGGGGRQGLWPALMPQDQLRSR